MKIPSSHPFLLGIVGGAGPLVAARLQWEFLVAYQERTRAREDGDYPPLVSINRALDGIDATGVRAVPQATASLRNALDLLLGVRATQALVACASLHACLPPSPPLPVIDWLGLSAQRFRQMGIKRVGVVGASSAKRDGVFRRVLSSHGVEAVELSLEKQVLADGLIGQGMTGHFEPEARNRVALIEEDLMDRGAQCIWWGCTELSLMPRDWMNDRDWCSMDAMVLSMLNAATQECAENPLPSGQRKNLSSRHVPKETSIENPC